MHCFSRANKIEGSACVEIYRRTDGPTAAVYHFVSGNSADPPQGNQEDALQAKQRAYRECRRVP
jgi:hypothetical protein